MENCYNLSKKVSKELTLLFAILSFPAYGSSFRCFFVSLFQRIEKLRCDLLHYIPLSKPGRRDRPHYGTDRTWSEAVKNRPPDSN